MITVNNTVLTVVALLRIVILRLLGLDTNYEVFQQKFVPLF